MVENFRFKLHASVKKKMGNTWKSHNFVGSSWPTLFRK
jgi:hypothetical protein